MKMTLRWEGMDDVLASLERLGELTAALDAAAEAGAAVLRNAANEAAPGPHIIVARGEGGDDDGRSAVTYEIGPDEQHWYYRYLETGVGPHEIVPSARRALMIDESIRARAMHPGMTARPFLRPALDTRRDAALRAAGRAIREYWQRVLRWR